MAESIRRGGCRFRALVGAHDPVLENIEIVDRDRLDAEIERSGFPRRRDAGFDQSQKLLEDCVLKIDSQCEQAVGTTSDKAMPKYGRFSAVFSSILGCPDGSLVPEEDSIVPAKVLILRANLFG